jgi:hypothetical protein
MLQKPIVRGASAAIHVAFIAMVLSFAWYGLEPRSWAGGSGFTGAGVSTIGGTLALALALTMAIGLILWLRKGQTEILSIPDCILLTIFGFVVWQSLDVRFVAAFLALAAALVPVLIDPRRQQRAAPPVYWPGYGPVAPSNPPRAPGSDEGSAPPPA